jgi:hypothetical protein
VVVVVVAAAASTAAVAAAAAAAVVVVVVVVVVVPSMLQLVCCRPLNKDAWVRFQDSPCGMFDVQMTLATRFSPSISIFPLPALFLHCSRFISLVHLSLTLYNLSN